MNAATLFDHEQASKCPKTRPRCETLHQVTACGCVGPCRFASWATAVAADLALSAPDKVSEKEPEGGYPSGYPDEGTPVAFLLSQKALGAHYPDPEAAFPGFYAFSYNPLDQGIRLISTLYSRAHAANTGSGAGSGARGPVEHRVGYRVEPGLFRPENFFAAGVVRREDATADLVYAVEPIDIKSLICRTQEDLEVLFARIVSATSLRAGPPQTV